MSRQNKPVTVTLGDLRDGLDARVKSGRYASASEVVRAGLRALDREEAALDDWMRRKVRESLDDPRPDISLEDAFAQVRAHRAAEGLD